MNAEDKKYFWEWDFRAAVDFVKRFEGCRLISYRDPAGVWTVGYGSTRLESGNPVIRNIVISPEGAEHLLEIDLERAQNAVGEAVRVPLTRGQFVALLDFAYNCGAGALQRSTLLKLLNAGKIAKAGYEFRRWTRAGGKELPGLVRRREAEKSLFMGERE